MHPEARAGTPPLVLVVDDNRQNRELARAHLLAAGYRVALADSGAQAVERVRGDAPDLVLLDILMPGMDGFETCRRIRDLPGGDDLPVVFLTALGDLQTHHRAMETGADDFLTKPLNRTELVIRVRSLLRIRQLNAEVRAQRDELLRVQAQKRELASLVVHDLKNPLGVILLHVQILMRDRGLSERVRRGLIAMQGASHSMHRMVLNLLDIARSEDGRLLASREDVDVAELVGEVVALLSARASERRVELERSGPSSLVACVDRDLVRRVIENLVDNALKYGPSDARVQIAIEPLPGSFRIAVRDEGEGIAPEHRERIFERYVRLGEREAGSSRGLGLSFCRLAAEAHGGTIRVEDARPGCVFVVELPLGR